MKSIYFINGKKNTKIGDQSFNKHYVFTTLAIKLNQVEYLNYHIARLYEHASYFGYKVPHESKIVDIIKGLLLLNRNLKIRIMVFNGFWAIKAMPLILPNDNLYIHGAKVIVTNVKLNTRMACLKTSQREKYNEAFAMAKRAGAFEGLLQDEYGHIIDGSRTGIMLLKNNQLLVAKGGLKSISCQSAAQKAKKIGIDVKYQYLTKKNINNGRLLLANSCIGVFPAIL